MSKEFNELTSLIDKLNPILEITLISFFLTIVTIFVFLGLYSFIRIFTKDKLKEMDGLKSFIAFIISFILCNIYFYNKECKDSYNGITTIKEKLNTNFADKNINLINLNKAIQKSLDDDNKITYFEYYSNINPEFNEIKDYIQNYNENLEKKAKEESFQKDKETLIKGLKNDNK